MPKRDPSTPPFLGERVRLRPIAPKDIEALTQILDQPALVGRRYLPSGMPELVALSEQQITEIQEKWSKSEKAYHFIIEHLQDQTVLGYAGCDWWWDTHHPSVHVVIDSDQHRNGFGSETLRLLLTYLFRFTPAHNISCWIASWNQAGLSFAAKHGFEEAGKMRRVGLRDGELYDFVVMNLLRPDWQAAMGGN